MFAKLFRKQTQESIPERLYGAVVAQARNPAIFTNMGLPDTVMGAEYRVPRVGVGSEPSVV